MSETRQTVTFNEPLQLTKGQWMVLLAAFLGWMFDGFEIGLFPVVARPALQSMLGVNDGGVAKWMGYITACFLLGAAAGGLLFGWLGDRIGRIRAMSLSILVYSLFTAVGYFAQVPWHLAATRFIAALGMGGEWALGVALVMECWPERWRPLLAGLIGAAANLGMLLVSWVAMLAPVTVDSWRWFFLMGALPALLVFFIRLGVPESEKWKRAVTLQVTNPLREIFGPTMLKTTCLGIVFASIALIGTWGSIQWIPLWVDQMTGGKIPGAKAVVQMASSFGAVVGCLIGPLLGGRIGRRPTYFILCLASLVVCAFLFRVLHEYNTLFVCVTFLAGLCTASFYGWFPLYLPELFPTRIRATGQGVCYNFGRIFAAVGALAGGSLVQYFDGSYARAGSVITLIYVAGLCVIWLAPETKGRSLPD